VQVFSATKARDRENLGDKVTNWMRNRRGVEVVNTVVTQSSDNEFHCLTITLFYRKGEEHKQNKPQRRRERGEGQR
jgi:hypothetical protein